MPLAARSASHQWLRTGFCLALACSFLLNSIGAAADPAPLSLASLEGRIPQAPGVLADESAIEEALEAVRVERDKAGLGYTYSNSFGPAAIIVPGAADNKVLRYSQTAGFTLPLGGSKITQQLAILTAQEREQIAIIALHESRRIRLAQLRDAYVQYWEYDSQVAIAQNYLNAARDERSKADTLRHTGFWTSTNLLDFLDSVQKVQADADNFHSSASAQLAQIDSAIGAEIEPFTPMAPEFFNNCSSDRTRALESAYKVDTTLAQFDAQVVQTQEELAKVHGATIEGSANAQAGSATDINHQVSGYSLDAGLNVSFPTHARDEERALRAQYTASLKTLGLRQEQRRIEIAAAVDTVLGDLDGTQTVLRQAINDQTARDTDLRTAIVRYNTIRQTADTSFTDVHTKRDELYIAARATAAARASLFLKANNLLLLAPGACGGTFTAIPAFTLPTPSPKRHRRASGSSPTLASPPTAPPVTVKNSPRPAVPTAMPNSTTQSMPRATQSPVAVPIAKPTPMATPAPAVPAAVKVAPRPTATPSPKPTATPSPKPTATPSPKPTATPSPKPTLVPAFALPTGSLRAPSTTSMPAPSPSPKPLMVPAAVKAAPRPTATATLTPTPKPIATPTPKPTATPTPKPTATPTPKPTATPTPKPTATPSPKPTATPSPKPTATSSPKPTATPSPKPTATPSPKPTATPSPKPSLTPAAKVAPTPKPTATPTPKPTATPSPKPTLVPAFVLPTGSLRATPLPSATSMPTPSPSPKPTVTPSPKPSVIPAAAKVVPTPKPTATPTPKPTPSPSPKPSVTPAAKATPSPTSSPKPSVVLTPKPSPKPTATPSPKPTTSPSPQTTSTPNPNASAAPSASPSEVPTAMPNSVQGMPRPVPSPTIVPIPNPSPTPVVYPPT